MYELFFLAIPLTLIGYAIFDNKKRKEYNKTVDYFLNTKVTNNTISETAVLGFTPTALNLYDIYAACDNHEEVLEVIEYRYNRTMGPDANTMDWFSKIEDLTDKGPRSLGNYVSAYIGQAGENSSIEFFENMGKKAELFENRTNQNDDIRVFENDGSYTDYSTKSLDTINQFNKEVSSHPESTHYIINSELYDKLDNDGLIDSYNEQGIEIIDGNFSHDIHEAQALEVFDDIHDAGDIIDDVSIVAISIFGVKTFNNVVKLCKKKQTITETGVNIGVDALRLSSAGVFAVTGGKIGLEIGTAINPGLGTILGGGVGILVGAVSGSKLFQWAKERIKWGNIIDAIDYFGNNNRNGLSTTIKDNIKYKLLKLREVELNIEKEQKLYEKYKKSKSPSHVICNMHLNTLKNLEQRVTNTIIVFDRKLRNICDTAAKQMLPDDPSRVSLVSQRLLGDLLISNDEILLNKINDDEKKLIARYKKQKKKSPNYPYKFKKKSDVLLKGLLHQVYFECAEEPRFHKEQNIFIWVVIILSTSMIIFSILN